MTDLEHFLVLLHSVPGIRDRTIYKILKFLYFEGISPTRFLEFDENTYQKRVGLSRVSSSVLANNLVKLLDNTQKLVDKMEERGFKVLSIFEESYPSKLKKYMESPPPILYIRGDIKLLSEELLALFNSRNSSRNSRIACNKSAIKVAKRFGNAVITGLYGKNYSFRDYIESKLIGISDRGILQISKKKLDRFDLVVTFSGLDDMGTPSSMVYRDRMIMSLGDIIVGLCIREGGNMVDLFKKALKMGKKVFVLENEIGGNIELLKLGIRPLKI